MSDQTFAALGLAEPLLRALDRAGFHRPTPIQAQAIPPLLDDFDLLGIAETGTGKTAAFALPIIQHLAEDRAPLPAKGVRALILAPTRELAIQIDEQVHLFTRGLRLRHTVVFGGVSQVPQMKALAPGVEILTATPGRLLDLMQQRLVKLDNVTHLVLDEADRMLDMGFVRDVMKIVRAVPVERQTMLFSATMPEAIVSLANELLYEPVRVEVTPQVVTVEKIEQSVIHVPVATAKRALLVELLENPEFSRVVVFTRTKRGANRVAEHLEKAGIVADAIHGNKSQGARQRALSDFKSGAVRVLVATDIAARGIDVSDISHVVNFELPDEPEAYVHRIGRTARAGRGGSAVAFCDPTERSQLKAIERLIKRPIPVTGAAPAELTSSRESVAPRRENGFRGGQRRRRAA